ncbi:MAG: hypothetical protein AAFO89_14100 [Planctomycetota bacterium]
MQDNNPQSRKDDVKPLSLESAILDVAPRVSEGQPKATPTTQGINPGTSRPPAGGRIKLFPSE